MAGSNAGRRPIDQRVYYRMTNTQGIADFVQYVGTYRADRWEKSMQRFEAADRQRAPKPGGILFVGSSSIRLWDTDKWFPGQGVINRGFGGSQIADVSYFADRIVLRYRPKLIVVYAGDNDVAAGKSAQRVFDDYRAFTTEFDEVVAAETLCDAEEMNRLRQNLDQQLVNLQSVTARLANRRSSSRTVTPSRSRSNGSAS